MEETSEKITYESLWKAIIRPPRDYYKEDDLGPSAFDFNGRLYIRKDFEIVDFRGKLLKVSFIEPEIKERPSDIMPCVIYLHANASSRVEGINMKKYLLKNDINICAFDFEGSGYSEGEYISLGFHEKFQVRNIVDFVEKYPGVGEIGLWGRSMGAATTLIYASMDNRIKAIVVDSPFSDFRRVAKEMCLAQVSVPGFLIEGAISIIGKSVYKKNGMKINEIKAIEAVKNCYIPVIFIHARDDDIVKFQHSLDLFQNYAGTKKEFKDVNGGHNGKRSTFLLEHVGRFFAKYLKSDDNDKNINNKNSNNDLNIKKDEDLSNSSSTKEITSISDNNFNFDLNKRRAKSIYDDWKTGDKKESYQNFNTQPNQEEKNINEINKDIEKNEKNDKIENKKENNNKINEKENLNQIIDSNINNNKSNNNSKDELNLNKNTINNNIYKNNFNTIYNNNFNNIYNNNFNNIYNNNFNNIYNNDNIHKNNNDNINNNINNNDNTNINNNDNNKIKNNDNIHNEDDENTIIRRKTIYDDLHIRQEK